MGLFHHRHRGTKKKQQQALTEYPEPTDSQRVMLVIEVAGGNVYILQSADKETGKYLLPKSLRSVVLIRCGSFVIAEEYTGSFSTGAVKGEIIYALLPQHVEHLRCSTQHMQGFDVGPSSKRLDGLEGSGGGNSSSDDEFSQNPNRLMESSSSSSSDEEQEEEEEEKDEPDEPEEPEEQNSSSSSGSDVN